MKTKELRTFVGMTIEIASVTHISAILQVASITWKQTYASILSKEQIDFMYNSSYTHDAILAQMQEQKHQFLVVYDEKNVALGFASYYPKTEKDTIYIPKLYIVPSAQGMGIGKALIAEINKIALKLDIHTISLNVNRFNSKAQAFYTKNGFNIAHSLDIPYHGYTLNDYIMTKPIK